MHASIMHASHALTYACAPCAWLVCIGLAGGVDEDEALDREVSVTLRLQHSDKDGGEAGEPSSSAAGVEGGVEVRVRMSAA